MLCQGNAVIVFNGHGHVFIEFGQIHFQETDNIIRLTFGNTDISVPSAAPATSQAFEFSNILGREHSEPILVDGDKIRWCFSFATNYPYNPVILSI
jgi:hypothetical protein